MITREELLKLLQSGKTPEDLATAFTSTLNEAMAEAKAAEEAEKERLKAEEAKFKVFCDMYASVYAYIDMIAPGALPRDKTEPKPLTKADMHRVDKAIKSAVAAKNAAEDMAKRVEKTMRKYLPKDAEIKMAEPTPITADDFLGFFDSFFN